MVRIGPHPIVISWTDQSTRGLDSSNRSYVGLARHNRHCAVYPKAQSIWTNLNRSLLIFTNLKIVIFT